MAKGFDITVKGLKETLNKLSEEADMIKKQVDFAIGVNVEAMATEAKNRVPVDTGRLKGSISASKNSDYNYTLVAQAKYAAYVEFGTGNLFVSTGDKDWDDLAAQFKGKGKRQVNLLPRPYLRPAVQRITPIMFRDIEDVLNQDERL
jgi:HK97 gp10 family phage protein